jgi:hypothetical protein
MGAHGDGLAGGWLAGHDLDVLAGDNRDVLAAIFLKRGC